MSTWSHEFQYSPRHCWINKDGVAILDGSFEDEVCPNPQEHPLLSGHSESTRWIREFGDLAPKL